MLSWEQAQNTIIRYAAPLGQVELPLLHCQGKVLAEPVNAPYALPAFTSSAMDGFAFRYQDALASNALKITGSIRAGDSPGLELKAGEACEIYTGAPLPRGLDTVIPLEDAVIDGDVLTFKAEPVKGAHIRAQGEEIKQGVAALTAGTVLVPLLTGYLAALGLASVKVYQPPRVGILMSGTELVAPGKPLRPGQIYDANSFSLIALGRQSGLEFSNLGTVADDYPALLTALAAALEQVDVLILSGGVSVGKYDFIKDALKELLVEEIFWKIAVKPGKPLWFGVKDQTLVFGLPGNPAAVIVSFYEFVRPALLSMLGYTQVRLPETTARLKTGIDKKPDRLHFMRGRCAPETSGELGVEILSQQDSHILRNFAASNCLALAPAGVSHLPAGSLMRVHLLP